MKTKFLGHAKIELVDFRLKKLETQA